MFRTMEWCEIPGFEPWWRRLLSEYKERTLRGGIEDRGSAVYWLFQMVRSDHVIEWIPDVLNAYWESITFSQEEQRAWTTPSADGSVLEDNLAHASAVVFAHHRLPSTGRDPNLVLDAVNLLCRHQDENGAWRTLTTDSHPSIESTAMALHALSLARPAGWARIATEARIWLWSAQREDGSWAEAGTPGPAYLTVLVLDAIALANEAGPLTFRPKGVVYKPTLDMEGPAAISLANQEGNIPLPVNPEGPLDRRKAVDEFISRMEAAGVVILRRDIAKAAGYADVTEFQRYQRGDRRVTKTATQNFNRILRMTPDQLTQALRRPPQK